jgi:glycosyltransferase involved in cell wall biosynthesis
LPLTILKILSCSNRLVGSSALCFSKILLATLPRMLLSICVLTFNRRKYLQELVESILKSRILEKTNNVELLILDNGSTDSTNEYIETISTFRSIRTFRRTKNSMGSHVFLELIQHSKAEWIILPGDDDIFDVKTLAYLDRLLGKLESNIMLAPFGAQVIDEEGSPTGTIFVPSGETNRELLLARLFGQCIYFMPATCFRRKIVENYSLPNSATVFDWSIWIKAICLGDVAPQDVQLMKYRQHSGQEQHAYLQALWDLERLNVFLCLIRGSDLSIWIQSRQESELVTFFDNLSITSKHKIPSAIDYFLTFELVREIAGAYPHLFPLIINGILRKGADAKLLEIYFRLERDNSRYKLALAGLNPTKRSLRDDTSLETKIDYYREYLEELASMRRQELEIQLSPFELFCLRRFRKIRNRKIVKGLVEKMIFRKLINYLNNRVSSRL